MALTKYKEGSLRELWSIALPLMLSSLSLMSMLFVDRLLLANYSTPALAAAVTATTLGWSFLLGWMSLSGIAEVFVAQYNGAGNKERLGEPVWQMIWLSLASMLCFFPLSVWGGALFFGSSPDQFMEREYFHWMMLFGPSAPLYTALCAFFIGQGKTRLITTLAIVTNVVNAILDVILIFGIEGWIPSLGVAGAAIATCGSGMFQVLVLGVIFLRKKNRLELGTSRYQLNFPLLGNCVRIGLPNAAFAVLEVFAWALFYAIMTSASERHITVAGIGQSLVILFFFFAEGMNKAVSTVSGNLIGAKKPELVQSVVRSGIKILCLFFIATVAGTFFAFDLIVLHFLPQATPEVVASIKPTLFFCMMCNTLYLLFEGIRMVFVGALTAAGDTMFILVAGVVSVWALMLLPTYIAIIHYQAPVEVAAIISVIYSLIIPILYFIRFYQGQWKNIALVKENSLAKQESL